MNYYPRFPAYYLDNTLHLTMHKDGAYTRIMDWYCAEERAIPHDKRFTAETLDMHLEQMKDRCMKGSSNPPLMLDSRTGGSMNRRHPLRCVL